MCSSDDSYVMSMQLCLFQDKKDDTCFTLLTGMASPFSALWEEKQLPSGSRTGRLPKEILLLGARWGGVEGERS